MPRLLGPLLLLLPKRRLVNQKIRPLCRIDFPDEQDPTPVVTVIQ